MRYTYLTLGLLFLAEQATLAASKVIVRSPNLGSGGLQHGIDVNANFRRRADLDLDHGSLIEEIQRRQAPAADATAPTPAPAEQTPSQVQPSPAEISWNNLRASELTPSSNDTQATCVEWLSRLQGRPSNPSGMSACYNIAAFDNSTGDFQTNVLIYRIGEAEDGWRDLAPGTAVELQYPGATVMLAPENNAKRSLYDRVRVLRRQTTAPSPPEFMRALTFVGTVTQDFSDGLTNFTIMREALSPVITLVGRSTTGEELSAQLPNREAAFVNGFFSDEMVAAQQANAAGSTVFVLPGTTLGFFPVGLVVTSAWALLFIAAVGAGTLGRFQFRQAYRRKTAGGQYGLQGTRSRAFTRKAGYEKS